MVVHRPDGRVYAFGEPLKSDLVPVSLVPGMLYSNQQSTITATIANDGAAGATAFNVSLEYEGTTIGITTIDSLGAGVEATIEFSWTPASTGVFDLTVTVDPENAIDESNETNNNLTRAIGQGIDRLAAVPPGCRARGILAVGCALYQPYGMGKRRHRRTYRIEHCDCRREGVRLLQ
jgi:hypothetical protein